VQQRHLDANGGLQKMLGAPSTEMLTKILGPRWSSGVFRLTVDLHPLEWGKV